MFWGVVKTRTANSARLAAPADTNAQQNLVRATAPTASGAFTLTGPSASHVPLGSFLGRLGLRSVWFAQVGSSAHLKDRQRASHACLVTSLAWHRLCAEPVVQACFKPSLARTDVKRQPPVVQANICSPTSASNAHVEDSPPAVLSVLILVFTAQKGILLPTTGLLSARSAQLGNTSTSLAEACATTAVGVQLAPMSRALLQLPAQDAARASTTTKWVK
jgi:hypothetical protein